jgi:hypothetical protein
MCFRFQLLLQCSNAVVQHKVCVGYVQAGVSVGVAVEVAEGSETAVGIAASKSVAVEIVRREVDNLAEIKLVMGLNKTNMLSRLSYGNFT